MASDKPTILKNSKKGWQLREGDVDLQGTARNPLETIEVAKKTALEKLREYTGIDDLDLSSFVETRWGIAYLQSSTKRVGTEFKCHKTTDDGVWELELNLDHPVLPESEFGKKKHAIRRDPSGPDRPHVGYVAQLLGKNGKVLKQRTAHVFVDDIAAARSPDKRDPFFLKPR
jgi:hypothetical protein